MSIQGYAEGIKCGVFEDKESKENAVDVIIAETRDFQILSRIFFQYLRWICPRAAITKSKKAEHRRGSCREAVIDRVRKFHTRRQSDN